MTKNLMVKLSPEMHEAITRSARRGGHTSKGFLIQALISFDPEIKRVWDKENGK
jgi:hypothetical protein